MMYFTKRVLEIEESYNERSLYYSCCVLKCAGYMRGEAFLYLRVSASRMRYIAIVRDRSQSATVLSTTCAHFDLYICKP